MRQLTRAAARGALASLAAGCGAVNAMRRIGSACIAAPHPNPAHDPGPNTEGIIPVLPGRGGTAHDLLTTIGYFHPRSSGEDRLEILERELPAVARTILSPGITHEARVGDDDPFHVNVKAFAKKLPHANVRSVEHGCHDDGFWRLTGPALLAFSSAH